MSAIEKLLSRLDGVSQKGNQYQSLCPAHADSKPSLAIKQVEDRVLLHCWAGCSAGDIMDAIGLRLADLYDKPSNNRSALSSHERRFAPPFPAADILRAISLELTVTVMAAEKVHRGELLTDDDMSRLYQAYQRVNKAIEVGGIR